MPLLILVLLVLALAFGPQWWARRTFARYAAERDDIPGSGGELARHLLDRYGLKQVAVETTVDNGDHYDPESRTVRLSEQNYRSHSLTAVAVAAHEVGHAIQHQLNDPRLALRTRLVKSAASLQRIGAAVMMVIPLVLVITRVPASGLVLFLAGFLSLGVAAVVHLVTLPVELDASFSKALPILGEGYISEQDQRAVRQILQAAALTYVAASLASLLNIWRWLVLLRRG